MSDTGPIMNVGAQSTPPTAKDVAVTAEWALWGKGARDAEYRLLACSDGQVGETDFIDQITRFSPGSAETWPQVTVSGFLLDQAADYVALAIHDTVDRRHDAAGREIVYTRYFCVPYMELCAGRAGYQDMYNAFARFWPSDQERSAKKFVLPAVGQPHQSFPLPGPRRFLAMRVAALLLTGRPVCVLGADGAGTSERLAFLDSVMSLLPYGMRSQLAGATWASSTAYDLNLQLFFADSRRRGNDHVVSWQQPDLGPIGDPYADQYLHWLNRGIQQPEGVLAAVTEPMGFDQPEVVRMLHRLDISYAKPPSSALAVAPPSPATVIASVLSECGNRLRGGKPNFLTAELDKLQQFQQFTTSPQDRAYLRQVIAREDLLHPPRSVDKQLQDELYRLLLRLAFTSPLTYEGYCQLEACLGEQPHKRLLQVMQPTLMPDLRARLLVVRALGGSELKRQLSKLPMMPVPLTGAVADPHVRADHAHVLCELAIPALCACPDPAALHQALHDHGYLAPALQRLYPAEPERQYETLGRLLRAAYPGRLNRADIPAILDPPNQPASVALFAAVVRLAQPADVPVAVYVFLGNVISSTEFDAATEEWLLGVLPLPDWHDEGPGSRGFRKRLHRRQRTPLQDRLSISPVRRKRNPP